MKEIVERRDGIWKKYEHGSSQTVVLNDIPQNKKIYNLRKLKVYDLYVYYEKDDNNAYANPQIMMWVRDGIIYEVESFNKSDGLSLLELEIVEQKLAELEILDKYKQVIDDQKRLEKIYENIAYYINKCLSKEIPIDDLKFLYEIERNIADFSSTSDGDFRVHRLLGNRNTLEDFCTMFGIESQDCYLNYEDSLSRNVMSGKIKFCPNDIKISEEYIGDVVISPKIVVGYLDVVRLYCDTFDLSDSIITNSVNFPGGDNLHFLNCNNAKFSGTHIYGKKIDNIDFSNARVSYSIDSFLEQTKTVRMTNFELRGNINFYYLQQADMIFMDNMKISGCIRLGNCYSSNVYFLTVSQSEIHNAIYLSFKNAVYLNFSNVIVHGSLLLSYLIEVNKLDLTGAKIFGEIRMDNLLKFNTIILPNKVYQGINLSKLKTANNILFPENMEGDLILSSLMSLEGVVLPKFIDGNLDINSVEDLVHLELPIVTGLIKVKGKTYKYQELCELLNLAPVLPETQKIKTN